MAGQQHDVEALADRQLFDSTLYSLGKLNPGQHLCRFVDGDDAVSETNQWVGDPADGATEIQDACLGGHLGMD